jgi:uncharacterized membrane protein
LFETVSKSDERADAAPSVAAPKGVSTEYVTRPVSRADFRAIGTEPFWSIEVSPGTMLYSTPELPKGLLISTDEAQQGEARRYSGSDKGTDYLLVIAPGECSDGMSDTVYAYKAKLKIGERTEQGCAKKL